VEPRSREKEKREGGRVEGVEGVKRGKTGKADAGSRTGESAQA